MGKYGSTFPGRKLYLLMNSKSGRPFLQPMKASTEYGTKANFVLSANVEIELSSFRRMIERGPAWAVTISGLFPRFVATRTTFASRSLRMKEGGTWSLEISPRGDEDRIRHDSVISSHYPTPFVSPSTQNRMHPMGFIGSSVIEFFHSIATILALTSSLSHFARFHRFRERMSLTF